jgi:hypothetical protein
MTRRTVRADGKPLTHAEICRRWRTKKKAALEVHEEAERRERRARGPGARQADRLAKRVDVASLIG